MSFLPYLAAHHSPGTMPRSTPRRGPVGTFPGPRQQQQAPRPALNRAQQQQGSTEYQSGRHPAVATNSQQPAPRTNEASTERPGAGAHDARHGGQGGTPVDMPQGGAANPGEISSYIDEASTNVDA